MEKTIKEQMDENRKKFDAVKVDGPFEASNGEQFFTALFEENADENGGYISQSRGYSKNFFETSHSRMFVQCEKYVNAEGKNVTVRMMAARGTFPCNPFYLFDKEKKQLMNTDGTPRIGSHITLFLLPDENPEGDFRRQTRRLKYVDIEETIDAEDAKKEEALKSKK